MTPPNPNTLWAAAFMDALIQAGVRDVSLAPGARSIPLVLACADRPELTITTHLDERAAGFFALGVAKATGRVPVVITTSGTATANLFPAVIEAAASGTPLLALTADRPPYLRGTDANQTINQIGLYGDYVRAFFDTGHASSDRDRVSHVRALAVRAVTAALGRPAGPVHVNLPFAKPLEPSPATPPPDVAGFPPLTPPLPVTPRAEAQTLERLRRTLRASTRPLLVAGPAARPGSTGAAMVKFARALAAPLLADPLSGARFCLGAGGVSVSHYDAYLDLTPWPAPLTPDLILRFGPAPTSASLARFLERQRGTPHVVIDDGWRWPDSQALATEVVRADTAETADVLTDGVTARSTDWTATWLDVDRAAGEAMDRCASEQPAEPHVLGAMLRALPEGVQLFVGNSLPIRDLDRYAGTQDRPIPVLANRGASGIDGLVSTAVGAATAGGTPTVAVLGDVSFFHDLTGCFALRRAQTPLAMVVINNDGGSIFRALPVRDFEPAFTRHLVVPHGLAVEQAAALFELPYHRARPGDAIDEIVREALAGSRPTVVEIHADPQDGHRAREQDREAARAAVRNVLHAGKGIS